MSKLGGIPGTFGFYGTGATPSVVTSNPAKGEATIRSFDDTPDDDAFAGPAPAGIPTLNPANVTIDTVAGPNVFTPAHAVYRYFDTTADLITAFFPLVATPDDDVVGQIWVARNFASGTGAVMFLVDRVQPAGAMRLSPMVDTSSKSVVAHTNATGETFSVASATDVVLGATGFFDSLAQTYVFPASSPNSLAYSLGELSNFATGQWEFYFSVIASLPIDSIEWQIALQKKPSMGSFADVETLIVRQTSELENGVKWSQSDRVSTALLFDDTVRFVIRHGDGDAQNATLFRVEWWAKAFGVSAP